MTPNMLNLTAELAHAVAAKAEKAQALLATIAADWSPPPSPTAWAPKTWSSPTSS